MSDKWVKVTGLTSPSGAYVHEQGGEEAIFEYNVSTGELRFVRDSLLGQMRGPVAAKAVSFTEDGEAGVYTGSVVVPAGAILVDVIVHNVALWDAGTSAAMIVGDAVDPNGFFDAIDLKATDLLAGEGIDFAHPGGQQGVDVIVTLTEGTPNTAALFHVRRRYLPTERVITGVITTVGTAGSAGRTRMIVIYVLPEESEATFVET
jgi:hypothetical protein